MSDKYYFIVLCGMDGSGKTTISTEIEEYLSKNNTPVHYYHGHGYSMSRNSFGIKEKNIWKINQLLKFGLPVILIDSWYTYYKRYSPLIKKQVLICDRYFYDKICRLIYYKILPKWLAVYFLKMLPKPDYVFFLDVNENVAYNRKEEHTIEEYKAFRDIYKWAADIINAPRIDTSKNLDNCMSDIIEHIS